MSETAFARRILVVEDDEAIRESIAELLEMEGYAPIQAEHGQRALEILGPEGALPSVIVLDLMMPVCSGYELLKRLRADPRLDPIPVVVISAAADGGATARQHGAEFVRKPLDADALLRTLERLV